MSSGPVRRGQLIAPFGVGAMVVNRDGVSIISAGLDHWYESETVAESSTTQIDEFKIREWRLERLLKVNHFRLPPDFRKPQLYQKTPNCNLTVPFLRFPSWHFCLDCNRLYEYPLSERGKIGKIECPECSKMRRRKFLYQVPLVAVCDKGHIQDFPWRQWVHRTVKPDCDKQMYFISTGAGTLAGLQVRCECGVEPRSLSNVMDADREHDTTDLTENLDKDNKFLCSGLQPWLGIDASNNHNHCGRPMKASLRSASNVYFAVVKSSVYLPRTSENTPSELISLLEKPPISGLVNLLKGLNVQVSDIGMGIRDRYPHLVQPFSDIQIQAAIRLALSPEPEDPSTSAPSVEGDDKETAFRRAEFDVLICPRSEKELLITDSQIANHGSYVSKFFSRVMLVERLRETRVLAGFTRIFPETDQSQEELSSLLWRNPPVGSEKWLPAYEVYGEGIFLELNEKLLQKWEKLTGVMQRIEPLRKHYKELQVKRKYRERTVSARFVLIHTFAHIFINKLIYDCGYSSAALRERLYVSEHPSHPMAGLLIYTAAGDAEGTMGGLVRMGKPGNLESVIVNALDEARWCSADPVCMEVARMGGQGPDSCNLAACHNCALVPETACEEFNRFLDRGVVVGEPDNKALGYFSESGGK